MSTLSLIDALQLPVAQSHHDLSVDAQKQDPGSCLSFTRNLLSLRKTHQALEKGSIKFLDTIEPVLAYERRYRGENLLCIFNLGSQPASHAISLADYSGLMMVNTNNQSQLMPAISGMILKHISNR